MEKSTETVCTTCMEGFKHTQTHILIIVFPFLDKSKITFLQKSTIKMVLVAIIVFYTYDYGTST